MSVQSVGNVSEESNASATATTVDLTVDSRAANVTESVFASRWFSPRFRRKSGPSAAETGALGLYPATADTFSMGEADKLNIDSIIARLLEGKYLGRLKVKP